MKQVKFSYTAKDGNFTYPCTPVFDTYEEAEKAANWFLDFENKKCGFNYVVEVISFEVNCL